MEGRGLWMWQLCHSKGCSVILEDFPEGGFISTSPGSEPVSLPVPAREPIMLWGSCRAEAGHGTSSHPALVPSISPWPQERAATHVFLPSGCRANRALCFHVRILKGQRLLRAKTLKWIEREHDVRKRYKNKWTARAACKRNRGGSDSRPAGGGLKKKRSGFFFPSVKQPGSARFWKGKCWNSSR